MSTAPVAPSPSSTPPAAPSPATPSAPPPATASAPPPATPSAPPPATPSAPPPATPSAPPPATPSTPPPATPSAPPPATPSAPPPATPSAPPPAVPSAPPPSTPSAPPPAVPSTPPPTPSTSPSPPASTPPPSSAPNPPSPPSTPSRPSPSGGGGGTPSPPTSRSPPSLSPPHVPPSKTPPPPPLPSSGSPSSSSISTPVLIGVVAAGAAVLLLLAVLCLCCRKRRKRGDNGPQLRPRLSTAELALPPPPPTWAKQKDDIGEQPQTWHQSVPLPRDHVINVTPSNLPPSVNTSRPSLPSPPVFSSSGGSGSNYSVSENTLPPSPRLALGFLKFTFAYEELERATNGFSDANLLGQGGFGYVHRGILPNGQEVAVKQLKIGSGQGDREFHAEVEIISRVHHKHLVSLVGYCSTGDRRLLVYEFVPNNTLEYHLHGKEAQAFEWPTRLKVALGSAKGLAYLHEDCHPKIIHRDIKASNILLNTKFEAKVADFGLAKITLDNDTHVSTRVMGTFGYLAPEYASSGKLTEKSDVFSFGVLLLEMITGRRPVDTTNAFMEDSLVDWARPLLARALEGANFETLADPRMGNYSVKEMTRMVACAAACIHYSARRRPRMSQVVRVLEGDSSFEILNEGLVPGLSPKYSSYSSSEYGVGQYNEDMKKFRKLVLNSQDYGSSDYPTSEYGQNPSASSSEAVTRDMEPGKINRDSDELR